MILGMSIAAFTLLHVIISLVGIAAGVPVVYGLLAAKKLPGWTALFLASTVLTSVTGFFFPFKAFGPAHIVGTISLALLTVAILALYLYKLAGAWRWVYVVTAHASLYLNVFIGVTQAFQKIPALQALAPTGTEVPFASAQAAVLALFIWIGVLAVKRFHVAPLTPPVRRSA